jgi:hypothetical protein
MKCTDTSPLVLVADRDDMERAQLRSPCLAATVEQNTCHPSSVPNLLQMLSQEQPLRFSWVMPTYLEGTTQPVLSKSYDCDA